MKEIRDVLNKGNILHISGINVQIIEQTTSCFVASQFSARPQIPSRFYILPVPRRRCASCTGLASAGRFRQIWHPGAAFFRSPSQRSRDTTGGGAAAGRQTRFLSAGLRPPGCEGVRKSRFSPPRAGRAAHNSKYLRPTLLDRLSKQKREPDKGAIQREASPIINSRRPRGHVGFVFKHETLVPHSKRSRQI